MPLLRSRARAFGLMEWQGAPLPKLPDIFCGIYTRGGADPQDCEPIADAIAAALRMDRSRDRSEREMLSAASNPAA
jgi:hypothetical protein